MMQEIASEEGGNFCGVCPVIGRLNCFCLRWRISLGAGELEESRYDSYLRLYEKASQIKQWELK